MTRRLDVAPTPTHNQVLNLIEINQFLGSNVRPHSNILREMYNHLYDNTSEQISKTRLDLSLKYFIQPQDIQINFDFVQLLPEQIRSAAKQLKISKMEILQILIAIQNIDDFLKSNNLQYAIDTETTVDPEYPNWVQICIILNIKDEFVRVYSQLRSQIYDLVRQNITNELYQKVLIKIEPS